MEYDGKSVSAIVICGGYFWPPKTGKEAQLEGLKTLTGGGLNPQPPAIPTLASGHREWVFVGGGPTTFPNKSKMSDGGHIEFRFRARWRYLHKIW